MAGGAVIDLLCGRQPNDYDIYFRTKRHLYNTMEKLEKNGVKMTSSNGELYNYENGMQLIGFLKFKTLHSVLKSFDISCCMYGTDGENIVHTSEALNNCFCINNYFSGRKKALVVKRIAKYMKKGHTFNPKYRDLLYLLSAWEWEDFIKKYEIDTDEDKSKPGKIVETIYNKFYNYDAQTDKARKYYIGLANNNIEDKILLNAVLESFKTRYNLKPHEVLVLRNNLSGGKN